MIEKHRVDVVEVYKFLDVYGLTGLDLDTFKVLFFDQYELILLKLIRFPYLFPNTLNDSSRNLL